jgi:hypothetical protein
MHVSLTPGSFVSSGALKSNILPWDEIIARDLKENVPSQMGLKVWRCPAAAASHFSLSLPKFFPFFPNPNPQTPILKDESIQVQQLESPRPCTPNGIRSYTSYKILQRRQP